MAKSKMGKKLDKAIGAVEKFVGGLKKLQKLGGEVVDAFVDLKGDTEDKPKK